MNALEEFPQTYLLFSDYYHEDWFLVYEDDAEIIRYFATQKGKSAALALSRELRRLVELADEQLLGVLEQLSRAYAPATHHGSRLREWLGGLAEGAEAAAANRPE